MADFSTIGVIFGLIATAGGMCVASVKFGFWVFDELKKRKAHGGYSIPLNTLKVSPRPPSSCWWYLGSQGKTPAMQIVGSLYATNTAQIDVRSLQVELRFGWLGRHRISGMALVSSGDARRIYGAYDIPPNATREISFDFWLCPPVIEAHEDFAVHSISIFDQFGNRSMLKKVRFPSHNKKAEDTLKEPEEFPYAIQDPIDREVVSVLKAEKARYKICGRSVGGLGSVHLVYQDRQLTGVGNDSWTPNSPVNQVVVRDPEQASLKSDNLDAIMAFYSGLQSDAEHENFKTALLNRLGPEQGYLDVSYFIVAVFFNIGALQQILIVAKEKLAAGDRTAYSMSNILMLLNGVLKYRHIDFSREILDEIERFIHGLEEHPFMIPEKLNAIRTARLTMTGSIPVTP